MKGPEYPVVSWMPQILYGDKPAETCYKIVTDIMAHPDELVTEVELLYTRTSTGKRTADHVRKNLDILCGSGLLTAKTGEGYTFYGFTDAGKQFLVDLHHYRGHEVWKELYASIERPPDVETAYNTPRPDHPPTNRDYEEHSYEGSDAWVLARSATFRTLTLSLERLDETTFRARLTEDDDGLEIDAETIEVDSVDDTTDDYREISVTEARGRTSPGDSYAIRIEYEHGVYNLQPTKNGGSWPEPIERPLYIFEE